ncbi:NAD(P)-dependent oxidoreductase [Rhodoplanes sp. TEM]|uniref:NAD(P)-dependent oxidoreductase n=1 Tax=Rhodoplanes tepidamans TaxID=200616 RepID=A0ABT5JDV1_RHOTP|nr:MULTISPECIES: NAD(P)-dependent oxidoreductase [Rhodoplanes]MDC7787854.1 NAD(P)-dependent oxidoreductase [Rhodoplanes tepidamans]MDC7985687.1 NAD(P)-dependent oxidoreductase [Rhodoplanes sp. TEM]MDQ0357883.1 3-hydroxyisobutyrate dehydrogenase-like beta-hydroxyacid dehydrogenase [Rhodoplanes tepidamans]
MQDTRSPLGLIGLGLIGTALAKRLLAAGFPVVGTDIAPDARARLAGLGGTAVDTVAEIARRCERVLIAVFNSDQVESVIEGADGLLAAEGRKTSVVLNFATCDPDRMVALAGRLAPRGLDFLETPLSGASDQVARGEAVCLVGGDEAVLGAARDVVEAVSGKHYFLGPVGNGAKAKLATNLILGLNRAALAEGLVYAEVLGLPLDAFFEAARNSAAYSQAMDVKGRKMITRDFSTAGKVVQSAKDFALILQTAREQGQTLPFAAAYAEAMAGCIAAGEGDWDNSAIVEHVRRARIRKG